MLRQKGNFETRIILYTKLEKSKKDSLLNYLKSRYLG